MCRELLVILFICCFYSHFSFPFFFFFFYYPATLTREMCRLRTETRLEVNLHVSNGDEGDRVKSTATHVPFAGAAR